MSLSNSDIIGIVTIIVSCPPLLLLIWKILDRMNRNRSERDRAAADVIQTYRLPIYEPVAQKTYPRANPQAIVFFYITLTVQFIMPFRRRRQ
ncbi:hypothetical protein BO70DRAFT_433619 [Aspergillus heteromorphus CBS 117.55]|uniref:Uncharacterized protein n=1 Tax=Aspergillus heteromorphus CBS 117.55 TaxID=1448321 RepID=A0A317URK8_9EURO|nr:uncharacterized protein BO70DRAFT_433619 [Aspergillus heteromorphus CBS 117.55]PWY64265.1 hypothetical protein BO70DRAFT_433619 [Aspergillus heteromorphus CBS 117.55]